MVANAIANVLEDAQAVEALAHCPLCNGQSFQCLPTPGHWVGEQLFSSAADSISLQRCQQCSLTFVNPRPSPQLLNAFYDGDTWVCHSPECGSASTAQFLLDSITAQGPYQGNRFLDFGCGGGYVLRAALEAKWDACGYDVGQRALVSCRAQGFTVTDNLDELPSSSFDVVLLNHVFEHVAEPHPLFSQCRRLLAKNGRLFIVVPNLAGLRARLSFPVLSRHFKIDERHRAFPVHLFYFTPQTLSRTLEKNGFRVRGVKTFGFGMNEFLTLPADSDLAGSASMKATSGNGKKKSGFRQMVKKAFFVAGLGENLMVIAESTQ
jgi:2-polyprenyl-3-methyl-5-hydroxy-6-metoxy-1,4-benzoquinol methylase